jgi:hypothetical protein
MRCVVDTMLVDRIDLIAVDYSRSAIEGPFTISLPAKTGSMDLLRQVEEWPDRLEQR